MLEYCHVEIKRPIYCAVAQRSQAMKINLSAVALAVCLALGTAMAGAQQPQQHDAHGPDASPPPPSKRPGGMMMDEKCAMMQRDMDDMSKLMEGGQRKLDQLVQEMNTATGPAKVEAMAAAVNEMVVLSREMHRMHADMMHKMMAHMSEHMAQGPGPQAQEKMKMCPMMQEHGGPGAAGAPGAHDDHDAPPPPKKQDGGEDDHSAHHPPN
jgi:hypothetical protein